MFDSSPVVKKLLIINIGVFLVSLLMPNLFIYNFALWKFDNENFKIWQFITHQFLHGGLFHLAFNLLALASLGPSCESYFDSKKFLNFYLISGLGSGLLHMIMVNSDNPIIGASGSIFGVLALFSILFPEEKLYFLFLIGVRAKWLFLIFLFIEIYLGFKANDGIGHWAHVGGAITGISLFLFDRLINRNRNI